MKTYAVVGHFDEENENKIMDLWKKLDAKEISNYGFVYDNRLPHITFVDLFSENEEEIICKMNRLKCEFLNLSIEGIGSFGNNLHFQIVGSNELREFHSVIYESLKEYVPNDSLYKPNFWIPHTTISSRIRDDDLGKIREMSTLIKLTNLGIEKLVLLEIISSSEVKIIYEIDINDSDRNK